MLRTQCTPTSFIKVCRKNVSIVKPKVFRCHTSNLASTLRAPLEIDTTLQSVLENAKFAVKKKNARPIDSSPYRELNIITHEDDISSAYDLEEDNTIHDTVHEETITRNERKSSAAQLGSRRIGSVTIPDELSRSIELLISGMSEIKMQFHRSSF